MKLIDTLNSLIREAKQVGPLYHFMPYWRFKELLDSKFILVDKLHRGYISFTRNSKLGNVGYYKEEHFIRLKLDGTKLSNKYKIKPFLDKNLPGKKEAEERVVTNKPVSILPYIMQIDILGKEFKVRMTQLQQLGQERYPKLKFNIVMKWR